MNGPKQIYNIDREADGIDIFEEFRRNYKTIGVF